MSESDFSYELKECALIDWQFATVLAGINQGFSDVENSLCKLNLQYHSLQKYAVEVNILDVLMGIYCLGVISGIRASYDNSDSSRSLYDVLSGFDPDSLSLVEDFVERFGGLNCVSYLNDIAISLAMPRV